MRTCDIWVFHVGRGVAGAVRTPSGKWIVIDLGASETFCPVEDFLLHKVSPCNTGKRTIEQLILSHPHNDHMTALKRFDKHFHPELLTVPNSNREQDSKEWLNWDRVQNPNDDLTNYLRERMLLGRTPPLRALKDESEGFYFSIHRLSPYACENELEKGNYPNNVSILARINYKSKVVLFAGDIMKDGMDRLIQSTDFGQKLREVGVDFLIAPHHGLRSSFSMELFKNMKNGKPALNIISEKPTKADSNEIVDTRYGDEEYASGHKVFINGKSELKRKLRTSKVGHIHIRIFEDGRTTVTTGSGILK